MIIKPLFTNILIQPLEEQLKTESGILLPESAKKTSQMGIVIEVGAGSIDEPLSVEVGQQVLYKKWTGNDIESDGKKLIIVEQKDILAIIQ